MSGFPVVIVESGGAPFVAVDSGAPVATVADSGFGTPITLVDDNAPPLVVEGLWSPSILFDNSEAGAWFDPSDLTSMFQDAAGTTAAEVDQPVGHIADKSGNGHHATQATSAARPTLRQDSNGKLYLDFAGSQYLTVAGSQAAFKFMHDGSGGSMFGAARFGNTPDPNAYYNLIGNNATSATNTGFNLRSEDRTIVPANDKIIGLISKGGVGNALDSANDAVPSAVNAVVGMTFATDATLDDFILYANGASVGSLSDVSSPSTADATYLLDIGAGGNGAANLTGRIYGIVIRQGVLSETDRGRTNDYFQRKIS